MKTDGKGKWSEMVVAISLSGFSLFYLINSFRLKLGTAENPGPGFFPVILGGLFLLCTTIYLIRGFRAKKLVAEGDVPAERGTHFCLILGILACTVAYSLVLETLKFIVSTAAVAFVMFILLNPRKPVYAFLLASTMSVVAFLVFSRLLGVGLPFGVIEEFLFKIGG